MLDVLQIQVERELVAFPVATVFRSAIGQDSEQRHAVLLEERQHPVIEHVGCRDRVLAVVELGKGELAVGVDEGLLVDAPDALQVADVVGVLRPEVARVLGLDHAVRLLVLSRLLERSDLVFCEDQALLGHLGRERLQTLLEGLQVMTQPDGAHAGG